MMPTPESHALALAEAGWPAVQESILEGLCHELNNRASSLQGLVVILRARHPSQEELGETLSLESSLLVAAVRALRMLLDDDDGLAAPFEPGRVVDEALELFRLQKRLASVRIRPSVPETLPPVTGASGRLTRVLLILLTRVAEAALGPGTGSGENEGAVWLEVRALQDSVAIDVGVGGVEAPWDAGQLGALRRLVEADGGRLTAEPDGKVRLGLPLLRPRPVRGGG